MSTNEDKIPFMRIEEAASYLGVNKTVLSRLAKDGRVPAFKFCNKWFFDKEKILDFFNKNIAIKGGVG